MYLKDLFKKTCSNLLFLEEKIELLWELIELSYSEPYRSYHNLQHIEEVVTYLNIYYPFEETKDLILFAGFFHDYYKTKDPLAEELSAQAATTFYSLTEAGKVEIDLFLRNSNFIHQAIMATKTHFTDVKEFQYLIDADLQRFQAETNIYSDQIRNEYLEHDDDSFNVGRKAILEKFLSRDPFYYFGSEKENKAAKDNIERQLKELNDLT